MLRKTALFPLHLASVFTGAKNFHANPVIGSKALNRLGLHVLRYTAAHGIWKLRQAQLFMLATADERRFYSRNGYLLKNDFLDAALFEKIVREVRAYNGAARQCVQGDTTTWRVFLDEATVSRLPALAALLRDKRYLRLLKYTGAKNATPDFYIQQIRNGSVNDADPQKKLHCDTFHPTMKAWLFLEDVPESKGPFTYVPGSNRLTLKRLAWEYRKSLAASGEDRYTAKGSFRVDEQELSALGLPQPQRFAVAKNTLVIANTHGFHARGPIAIENATRLEIWAYSRNNPFNPFAGFDVLRLRRVRHRIYQTQLQKKDRQSERKNTPATWHRADGAVV